MWARGGACDAWGEPRGVKVTACGRGVGWSAPSLTRMMSLDGRQRGAQRLSFDDYECRRRSGGGAGCPCHARIPVLVAIPRAVGAQACAVDLWWVVVVVVVVVVVRTPTPNYLRLASP